MTRPRAIASEEKTEITVSVELDPAAFAGCRRVGVTAGASTPENQIAAVEKFLRAL